MPQELSEKEVFEKVVNIVKRFAKDQEALAQVNNDTKILADLKVNSARLVDVILDLETQFDLEVGDDEADRVRTVGDVVHMILAKKG